MKNQLLFASLLFGSTASAGISGVYSTVQCEDLELQYGRTVVVQKQNNTVEILLESYTGNRSPLFGYIPVGFFPIGKMRFNCATEDCYTQLIGDLSSDEKQFTVAKQHADHAQSPLLTVGGLNVVEDQNVLTITNEKNAKCVLLRKP